MYVSKKSSILIVLLLNFTIASFAQPSQNPKGKVSSALVFSNQSWKGIVASAQKSGKLIFVDAYATWCGPCKLLKSTTFKAKATATFFNKNFINYSIDTEKGDGLELSEKWEITAYPTLLFFSPTGKMLFKQVGYVDGQKLLEIGQELLKNEMTNTGQP